MPAVPRQPRHLLRFAVTVVVRLLLLVAANNELLDAGWLVETELAVVDVGNPQMTAAANRWLNQYQPRCLRSHVAVAENLQLIAVASLNVVDLSAMRRPGYATSRPAAVAADNRRSIAAALLNQHRRLVAVAVSRHPLAVADAPHVARCDVLPVIAIPVAVVAVNPQTIAVAQLLYKLPKLRPAAILAASQNDVV